MEHPALPPRRWLQTNKQTGCEMGFKTELIYVLNDFNSRREGHAVRGYIAKPIGDGFAKAVRIDNVPGAVILSAANDRGGMRSEDRHAKGKAVVDLEVGDLVFRVVTNTNMPSIHLGELTVVKIFEGQDDTGKAIFTELAPAGYQRLAGANVYGAKHPDGRRIVFSTDADVSLGWVEAQQAALRRAAETTSRVLSEVVSERAAVLPVCVDSLVATPEFERLPDSSNFKLRSDETEDEAIMRLSAPTRWIVQCPFAEGRTAEEAIERAQALIKQRAAALDAARQAAAETGLPELTGSERQVAWAMQIRAAAAAKNPKLVALKTATTARYWIDRRNEFTS